MGKIRVYELAKELGLDNQDTLKRLQAMGFAVKSHSSTVDDEDARRALTRPPEKKVEDKKVVRTVIRRAAPKAEGEADSPELNGESAVAVASEAPAPAAPTAAAVHAVAPPAAAAAPLTAPVAATAPDRRPEPAATAAPLAAAAVTPVAPVAPPPSAVVSTPPPVRTTHTVSHAATHTAHGSHASHGTHGHTPHTPSRTLPATPAVTTQGGVQAIRAVPPPPAVAAAEAAAAQAGDGTSRVVRSIDPEAIRARLQAEGRNPGGQRTQRREYRVVPGGGGPRGPQMVDVTQGGFRPGGPPGPRPAGLPGSAPPGAAANRGKKPGGREGGGDDSLSRREMAEKRAGARDMWVSFGKKKKASKRGQETQVTTPAAHKRVIDIQGTIQVGELARQMATKVGDVIRKLMTMGVMATMNQTVDYDTAAIIATEFGFEVKNVAFQEQDLMAEASAGDPTAESLSRPPVVTIMGHVDHGKTSLLDAIRAADVAAGEAGGITQHIGAYSVTTEKGVITFLDTPGHEAFTAMRARGAKLTDIVILVVAADDGIMPQTIEAANHAKSAQVPVIVALNKMDKPDANPDRVMQQLSEHGLVPEAWGGETQYIQVSAKKKTGISELLDALLLRAEVMELKAPAASRAKGTIVEAQLDKGRGPVATVLVQEGTLRVGDNVVAGDFSGRVRAMYDDLGNALLEATPSIPVAVLGLDGVPNAGDKFDAVADAETAKTVASHRRMKTREKDLMEEGRVTLDNFLEHTRKEQMKQLRLIIKGDVHGSVEAVSAALQRLSNNQVRVNIVHQGVGAVTESDVNLAVAGNAIIIGFGVRADPKAAAHAQMHNVDIRSYSIIYEAAAEVRAAMEGLLAPTIREKYIGRAEVRAVFSVAKVGQIAGCMVTDGKITRAARVKVLREGKVMFEGKISSLKRFKDDAREVVQGFECGISVDGFGDVQVGDTIEANEQEVIRAKLEGVPDPSAPYKQANQEARA